MFSHSFDCCHRCRNTAFGLWVCIEYCTCITSVFYIIEWIIVSCCHHHEILWGFYSATAVLPWWRATRNNKAPSKLILTSIPGMHYYRVCSNLITMSIIMRVFWIWLLSAGFKWSFCFIQKSWYFDLWNLLRWCEVNAVLHFHCTMLFTIRLPL